MLSTLKQRLLLGAAALTLLLGGTAYALADRYLIEHVEIANVNPQLGVAVTATAVTVTETSAATAVNEDGVTAEASASAAASATAAATATAAPVYDDWSYVGDGLAITISPVVTGTGDEQVTYFVADVVVSDATQLASAFAKNSFGLNIVEDTSVIAAANNALFAINGDYYGFRSDGIVIRNGVIYRDAPARLGLAFYTDGTMQIYDETQTTAQALLDAGVWNTLSFGPALITAGVVATDLDNVQVDTNFGNRTIEGNNPRTGVGLIAPNHFVFVVVDGRSPGYSRGVTLTEFAQIFADLGATQAYNIDGGGSSTLYFMGRVVNNPLGRNQERGTSDILYVGEQ